MKRMLEEQETHFNLSADNRKIYRVFSDDPVMQKRLERIGLKPVKVTKDGLGKEYELPFNQLTLRKPMSEAAKASRSASLAAHREARKPSIVGSL